MCTANPTGPRFKIKMLPYQYTNYYICGDKTNYKRVNSYTSKTFLYWCIHVRIVHSLNAANGSHGIFSSWCMQLVTHFTEFLSSYSNCIQIHPDFKWTIDEIGLRFCTLWDSSAVETCINSWFGLIIRIKFRIKQDLNLEFIKALWNVPLVYDKAVCGFRQGQDSITLLQFRSDVVGDAINLGDKPVRHERLGHQREPRQYACSRVFIITWLIFDKNTQ